MAHRIIIEAIPAAQQRYCTGKNQEPTQGDWRFNAAGELVISITGDDMLNPETFLIGLHELVEVALCHHRGISQQEVDQFDFAFKGEGEPGDDPASPYRAEHRQAMLTEHLVANFMGLDDYGKVE